MVTEMEDMEAPSLVGHVMRLGGQFSDLRGSKLGSSQVELCVLGLQQGGAMSIGFLGPEPGSAVGSAIPSGRGRPTLLVDSLRLRAEARPAELSEGRSCDEMSWAEGIAVDLVQICVKEACIHVTASPSPARTGIVNAWLVSDKP